MLNYRLSQKLKLLGNGEFNHLTISLTCVNVCCLLTIMCAKSNPIKLVLREHLDDVFNGLKESIVNLKVLGFIRRSVTYQSIRFLGYLIIRE